MSELPLYLGQAVLRQLFHEEGHAISLNFCTRTSFTRTDHAVNIDPYHTIRLIDYGRPQVFRTKKVTSHQRPAVPGPGGTATTLPAGIPRSQKTRVQGYLAHKKEGYETYLAHKKQGYERDLAYNKQGYERDLAYKKQGCE